MKTINESLETNWFNFFWNMEECLKLGINLAKSLKREKTRTYLDLIQPCLEGKVFRKQVFLFCFVSDGGGGEEGCFLTQIPNCRGKDVIPKDHVNTNKFSSH